MKQATGYTLLALAVLALTLIPVGSAVFLLGFWFGDSPCVMCWQQRTGMALIALIGLFVLRYGPRPKYIGLSILVGAWGIFMGVRHTALHAARDIGQGFSVEILGAHTYTWSVFIFWACVVTMGLLLMVLKDGELAQSSRALRPLDRITMVIFLVVIAGNILQAFASTGPPPFMGQSDPIRFSFNPKNWHWSAEEWTPSPISLRGRWAAEKPGLEGLPADPEGGPLAGLPALGVKRRVSLSLPLEGTPTDLAYDKVTDRFLLTTQRGIYLVDGAISRVLRHTIIDPGFSADLGRLAGAAFIDSSTVMALSENKSYVLLRESDQTNAGKNYRFFLKSFDQFEEITRSRLATIRARMMYVMSVAYDPASESLYTITVPNTKTKRLVVSRFDRKDLTLSEEFFPRLAPGTGPALRGNGRSLDELYVTGATVAEGRLYLVSPAYGTLLTIDLKTQTVAAAHALQGVERAAGLAVKGSEIFIVGEGGAVFVLDRPGA